MAKPTIASLTAELEEAKRKIEELEKSKGAAADGAPSPDAEEAEALKAKELEVIKKKMEAEASAKIKELEEKHAAELDAVANHAVSPETEEKLKNAVDNLKGKALLFKKMSLALAEVKRIPKSGWNSHFKYKYAQEGDILDGIRPILADVGLMLWTDVIEESREPLETFYKGKSNGMKTFTKVKMKFTIGCADTGEFMQSTYSGEGEDESDKGLYKAYTGATKYFLTKNFLISSGDILIDVQPSDPEADTQFYNDRQNAQEGSGQPQNQNRSKGNPKSNSAPDTGAGAGKQASKAELLGFWKILGGSDNDFEPFYTKQVSKAHTHEQIKAWLQKKIEEKKEAEAAAKNTQQEAPPEPENTEPEPQGGPKDMPEPKKSAEVDQMSVDEYIAYVESVLPFPLTDSEKAKMRADAEAGKRDHQMGGLN